MKQPAIEITLVDQIDKQMNTLNRQRRSPLRSRVSSWYDHELPATRKQSFAEAVSEACRIYGQAERQQTPSTR